MKYICLGYMDEKLWDRMSEKEQKSFIDECLQYDMEHRKKGYFVGGEALQSIKSATTVRFKSGRISVTDGPFAETKEHLGGILILKARDLNEAIQLMSNHPSTRMGSSWEIRPSNEEINALFEQYTS